MTYPDDPGFARGSDTSREAADRLETQGKMERFILSHLQSRAHLGYTCDELAKILVINHPMLQSGTIAARLRGLELKGLVVKTKDKRPTRNNRPAHVWTLPGLVSAQDVIQPLPEGTRDKGEHSAQRLETGKDSASDALPSINLMATKGNFLTNALARPHVSDITLMDVGRWLLDREGNPHMGWQQNEFTKQIRELYDFCKKYGKA